MDQQHPAKVRGLNGLAGSLAGGMEADIEVDGADPARPGGQLGQMAGLLVGKAQGLFAQHMLALLQQSDRHFIVQVGRRADMDAVDLRSKQYGRIAPPLGNSPPLRKCPGAVLRPADHGRHGDAVGTQGIQMRVGDSAGTPDCSSWHDRSLLF